MPYQQPDLPQAFSGKRNYSADQAENDALLNVSLHQDWPPIESPFHKRHRQPEQTVIRLYSRGLSPCVIAQQVKKQHGILLEAAAVKTIIQQAITAATMWQNRPLQPIYLIVWLHELPVQVTENGQCLNKRLYVAAALRHTGVKEVLGAWLTEEAGQGLPSHLFSRLRVRGVNDLLITCASTSMMAAAQAIFPLTMPQPDFPLQQPTNNAPAGKVFSAQWRRVYQSANLAEAEKALASLEAGHVQQYSLNPTPEVNKEQLASFFQLPPATRRLLSYNRLAEQLYRTMQPRALQKTPFTSEIAAMQALYLAVTEVESKAPISTNLRQVKQEFLHLFGNRCRF